MNKPFTARGCFTFGKFKGRAYAEVAFKEPGYVRWCEDKIDGFRASMTEVSSSLDHTTTHAKESAEKISAAFGGIGSLASLVTPP